MGGCLNKPSNAQAAKKQEDHTNKNSANDGIQLESTSKQGSSSSNQKTISSDTTVNALHSAKDNGSSQSHSSDIQKAQDIATNEPSQLRESMSFRKSNLADVSIISSSSSEDNHSGEHDSIRLSTFQAQNGENNDTKNPLCDEVSPRPSLLEILAQEVDSDDDENAPPRALSFSTSQPVNTGARTSSVTTNAATTNASTTATPSRAVDPEDDRLTLSTQVNAKMWVQSASVLYQPTQDSFPEENELDIQLAPSKEGEVEVGASIEAEKDESDSELPPAPQRPSQPPSPPPTLPTALPPSASPALPAVLPPSPPPSQPSSNDEMPATNTDPVLASDTEVPQEADEDEDEDEDDFGMRSPLHQLSQRISDHNILHHLQQAAQPQPSSPLLLSQKKTVSTTSDTPSVGKAEGNGVDEDEEPAVLSAEERQALQSFFGVHTNTKEASQVADEETQEGGSLRRFDSYGATLLPQRSTSTSFSASFSQHPSSNHQNHSRSSRHINNNHNVSTFSIASEAEDEVVEYTDSVQQQQQQQQQKEMSMSAQSLLSAFANIDDDAAAENEIQDELQEHVEAQRPVVEDEGDRKEEVTLAASASSTATSTAATESVTTADHYTNVIHASTITDTKEQTESKASDAAATDPIDTSTKEPAHTIETDTREGPNTRDTSHSSPDKETDKAVDSEQDKKAEEKTDKETDGERVAEKATEKETDSATETRKEVDKETDKETDKEASSVAAEAEDDSNYAGFTASSAAALPRFQLNQLGGAKGGAKPQKSAEELAHEENKRAHFARLGRAALVTTTLPASSSARDDGAGDMHRTNNNQNHLLRVRSNNNNPTASSTTTSTANTTQKLGASALLGGRGGGRGGVGRGRFGMTSSASSSTTTSPSTASATGTTAAGATNTTAATKEVDREEDDNDLFDVYASTSTTASSSSATTRGGVRGGAQGGVRSISMDSSSTYLASLQREVVDEAEEEDSASILAALNNNHHSTINSTTIHTHNSNSSSSSDSGGTSSVSRTVALFNSRGGGRGGGPLLKGRGGGARGSGGRGST